MFIFIKSLKSKRILTINWDRLKFYLWSFIRNLHTVIIINYFSAHNRTWIWSWISMTRFLPFNRMLFTLVSKRKAVPYEWIFIIMKTTTLSTLKSNFQKSHKLYILREVIKMHLNFTTCYKTWYHQISMLHNH